MGFGLSVGDTNQDYTDIDYAIRLEAVEGGPYAVRNLGYTYDNNGNMTAQPSRTLTWNAENQPSMINKWPVSEQYRYDANNERVRRVVSGGSTPGTTYYIGGMYEESMANGGGNSTTRTMYTLNGQVIAQREIAPDASTTPTPTATYTPTNTPTSTPTNTATRTNTSTPTSTSIPVGCQSAIWVSSVNVTVSGTNSNTITKSGGSSYSWDAGSVTKSTQSITSGDGYVQATAGSDLYSVAFGLSVGDTNQDYTDWACLRKVDKRKTLVSYYAGRVANKS